MFLIKIVGEKNINVFTATNFEVYVGFVRLFRNNESILEIPLEENDIIYIMDANGNTIDSFSPRLDD